MAGPAEMPPIFYAQFKGMLMWYRNAVRDYRDCLVEQAIADRSCKTWEQTVDRALEIHKIYGGLVASAKVHCPDLLTDEEKEMVS